MVRGVDANDARLGKMYVEERYVQSINRKTGPTTKIKKTKDMDMQQQSKELE